MAGGGFVNPEAGGRGRGRGRAQFYEYKITAYFIYACVVGSMGGSLFGYDLGVSVPLYLSEMAPAKIRGLVNQLFQLSTCLGILIASFVNYGFQKRHPWGWRGSVGLATIPATLMFIGGLLCPETPNSLVEQGKLKEARDILEKVRGAKNVQAEMDDIIDASEAAKAIKNPFGNLLKRKNRPQLIIGSLAIPAFQQLTGNNSILFYVPVMFQSLGLGSNASIISAGITNSALVLAPFISMALVDRWGRRTFFLEAGAEMIVYMVAVGITLAKYFGHGEPLSKGINYFLVIIIFLFVLAFGRSWGPLGWLVPSELFPLETRSASQSIVVCVNMIFTTLVAQFFLVSLCHLKYGIFLLFAGLIVIMSLFIYLFLPETKQVPIEEVHLLFQKHWYWKRFYDEEPHSEKQPE